MKSKVIYGLIVAMMLIALIFTTMSSVITDSQNKLNSEIFLEAKETRNFDRFVSLQSIHYKLIDEVVKEDYLFNFYHIVGDKNEQGFLVIIIPTTKITYATDIKDENDKTKLVVTNTITSKNVIDTTEVDGAISYGYSEDKIGFMFFYEKIEGDFSVLNVIYYDYNGDEILNNNLDFKLEEESFIESSFETGMTLDEIKDQMNYADNLKKQLLLKVGIYLAVVILTPFIFALIKRIYNKKNEIKE